LFGAASTPAPAAGGLFGASAASTGGLFGAAPATTGGLFGATPGGGSLFGASAPAASPAGSLPLAAHQPPGTMLATVDGQPVKHFTQWGELAPHSQQQLQALEAKIVAAREDSKTLDGVARLRDETYGGRTYLPDSRDSRGAGGGAARRRELERSAKAASDALKLLETQLWSDNERLGGLREAVVATLRDAEHARARLTRLREADDAEAASVAHARTHPGHPLPAEATPVFLPAPQRPSAFLKGAVERLYAAAEGFERGTLEMERNLRTTGRVHGHGGAGPGLEALAAALHGGSSDVNAFGVNNASRGAIESERRNESFGDAFDAYAYGDVAFDASRADYQSPAELRAAVEGAQRYFNKVGGDLARLHEKVRRAKAEHLAALRRRGEHRDPFAEAEAAEAEYARLSAMAERPGFASAPPAGLPGANAPALAALPAPGTQTPGATPGATPGGFGFGGGLGAASPASTPAMFGAASAASTGGGLFGAAASPAPAGGFFGAAASPAPAGGLFGAAASPAPSGGLFGAAASSPAPSGGLFGAAASSPAPSGGLFGAAASSPAPSGGLFGAAASSPAPSGGRFGAAAPATPSFGAPATGGGGLFGAGASSAPAFGSPAPAGGGLFGAPATPGAFGAPATQQPRRARRR
jgi:hypothetical protein